MPKLLERRMMELGRTNLSMYACGSRVTCNPAPTDTDQDWVCMVPMKTPMERKVFANLKLNGWIELGDPNSGGDMPDLTTWRKGEDNLLVIGDVGEYNKFIMATRLAHHFNILNKEDRILLFRAVCDGVWRGPTSDLEDGHDA